MHDYAELAVDPNARRGEIFDDFIARRTKMVSENPLTKIIIEDSDYLSGHTSKYGTIWHMYWIDREKYVNDPNMLTKIFSSFTIVRIPEETFRLSIYTNEKKISIVNTLREYCRKCYLVIPILRIKMSTDAPNTADIKLLGIKPPLTRNRDGNVIMHSKEIICIDTYLYGKWITNHDLGEFRYCHTSRSTPEILERYRAHRDAIEQYVQESFATILGEAGYAD